MTANHSIDPAQFLSEHLERAEPDLLRSMLRTFIETLMGAGADALCGAPYGVRTDYRVNSRNGYRSRESNTRAGTMDVGIPKLRAPGSLWRIGCQVCRVDLAIGQKKTRTSGPLLDGHGVPALVGVNVVHARCASRAPR